MLVLQSNSLIVLELVTCKYFLYLELFTSENSNSEMPDECPTFYGPHSMDCLRTIWKNVGCLPEGDEFPDKLSLGQINAMTAFNYR